jgi:hypothetical protein
MLKLYIIFESDVVKYLVIMVILLSFLLRSLEDTLFSGIVLTCLCPKWKDHNDLDAMGSNHQEDN